MRREKNKNSDVKLHIETLDNVVNMVDLVKYVKRVCKCDSNKEAQKYLLNSVNPLRNSNNGNYFFKSTENFINKLQYDLRTKFSVITYIMS